MKDILSILFITYEYPPETGGGGIGTEYYELANTLANLGHNIWVISHTNNEENYIKENNVNIIRIQSYKNFHKRKKGVNKEQFRSWAVVKKMLQLLEHQQFDIIEFPELRAEGYYIFNAKIDPNTNDKLKNIKTIVRLESSTKPYWILNNLIPSEYYNQYQKIIGMEKAMIQNCDLVISHCKSMIKDLMTAYKIDKLPVSYIPPAVDSDYFVPSQNLADNSFIFGYVGTICYHKGVDTIIDAFSKVCKKEKKSKLYLVGKDSKSKLINSCYDKFIKDIPQYVKNRIIYTGPVERLDLKKYYHIFDTFVIGSHHENFPFTVLEAMSSGLPVIASNVGGIPEMIGEKKLNGFFESGDSDELASQMIALINNSSRQRKAALYNRERILNNFTRDISANMCIKVYRKLLENREMI